ncbi:MAG: hypothetical protein ACLTG4_10065 [Oscillospiraceae bacterium]
MKRMPSAHAAADHDRHRCGEADAHALMTSTEMSRERVARGAASSIQTTPSRGDAHD